MSCMKCTALQSKNSTDKKECNIKEIYAFLKLTTTTRSTESIPSSGPPTAVKTGVLEFMKLIMYTSVVVLKFKAQTWIQELRVLRNTYGTRNNIIKINKNNKKTERQRERKKTALILDFFPRLWLQTKEQNGHVKHFLELWRHQRNVAKDRTAVLSVSKSDWSSQRCSNCAGVLNAGTTSRLDRQHLGSVGEEPSYLGSEESEEGMREHGARHVGVLQIVVGRGYHLQQGVKQLPILSREAFAYNYYNNTWGICV